MVREAEEADQVGLGVGQRVPHGHDVGFTSERRRAR
jgi:hypothetical protein